MSNKTALVVDDSKSARFALRKYLEGQSFKVDTAENAQEAFNFLKTHHPDLIFLDHVMPGTDGFEALHHIKNDPMTVTIPVVICSSNEGEQFVSEARSRGAADVLQKPPSPEQLLRILDNLQRMSAALRSVPPPKPPEAPRAVPPAAPSKVSNIREPDIAIEQAVMKALRTSMPQAPAAPSMPPPATPAFNPLTTAGFMASAQVPPSAPPPVPVFNPSATFNPAATGAFNPAATGAFNPSATGAFNVPPIPAPPVSSPKADAAFAQHLRDQIETRMKKMTQDLFMQIAELKANIAHLESHERSPEDEQAALQAATQSAIEAVQPQLANIQASISNLQPQISNLHASIGSVQPQLGSLQAGIGNLQARIEVLERNVESSLSEMRAQFDHALQQQAQRMEQQAQRMEQQAQRMEQIAQEGRAAAAEEAHAAAERHVMSAASRIADQLAEGIRKALGRAA